ncbi:MAG: hypothetical protein HFI44_09170 [Lachnospiraceae bacterium]|nr:hypothetical protein [Lachnospiraceae bacterium]GFI01553.1 hypothetical protein IMSAGC005_00376 [Lachnospiraceae bacterium]
MDSNEHNKVIAFDTLFCTNHIQMLKVILPYMDDKTQKSMAIYIKFLELNYTIEYFKRHSSPLSGCMEREASPDPFKMCSELLPYCTENERKQIEQIRGVFQSMEMYKEMSRTMEMMKDFMPDLSSFVNAFSNETDPSSPQGDDSSGGGFDMMGMLMNMLTPEQKQMYEMFGGNQNAE